MEGNILRQNRVSLSNRNFTLFLGTQTLSFIGSWELHTLPDTVRYKFFSFDFLIRLCDHNYLVHPEDHQVLKEIIADLKPAQQAHLRIRVISPELKVAELEAVGQIKTFEKENEEALQQSEEKYRTLYNSIDEGSYQCEVIFDENNKAVDILYLTENTAAIRMIGKSFVGKRLSEINPLYEEYWYQIWGEVAITGISTKHEQY